MKLFVSTESKQAIDGYDHLPILYGKWHISNKLSANSQSHVVALDALDAVDFEDRNKLLSDLVGVMRSGSEIVVTGTDIFEIASSLSLHKTSIEDFNKIVNQNKSFSTARDVVKTLKSLGLKIATCQLQGVRYEIIAER